MKSHILKTALTLSAGTCLPMSAYADEENDVSFIEELEEIVITATKRSKSMQDVAMSIKAINGALLEERGDRSFEDYAASIPSLTFQKVGNAGQSQIILRGLGPTSGAGTVSTYVDGASMSAAGARSDNPDFTLFDIDRIEVLRGPQGTLYGEGSVGGTIKLITKRPNTNSFEAKVAGGFESYSHGGTGFNYNGMINLPIVEEKFAIRAVAAVSDNDGYIDAPLQGLEDINTNKTKSLRLQARWNVTDALTATMIYNYQDADFGSNNRVVSPVDDDNPYTINTFHTSRTDINLEQINLLVDWDLGWATLESVSSISERIGEDFTERNSLLGGASFPSSVPSDVDIKSEELRLVSNGDTGLDWILGFYYKDTHRVASLDFTPVIDDFDTALPLFGLPDTRTGVGLAPGTPLAITTDETNELISLFGEVNWEFSADWNLTVGLRYFNEDVTNSITNTLDPAFTYVFAAFGVGAFPVPGSFATINEADISYSGLTWKVVLDHKVTEDVLTYASVSTGFRSGGANAPSTFASTIITPQQYDEDEVINYELGLKSTFLDNRLRVNAAAFLMDWSDMQIDSDPTQLTLPGIKNGPDAQSKGVELDIIFIPTAGLTLSAGGAYIDAETSNPDIRFEGTALEQILFGAGEKLPNTASFTGNISAAYEFEIFDGINALLRADYSYRSETFGNLPNLDSNRVAPYSLFNVRAGLISDDAWRVSLYANNVFNENKSITEFQGAFANLVQPRTVGLSFTYDFQ